MDSETAQRRTFNIGPHGTAPYDRNFALTQGARRYDQVFDSNASRASHENSMEFGSSRVYDSGLGGTNVVYRRSETEQVITTKHQVHFQTKTNDPIKPYGALGTIDEDRTSVNQSTIIKKQGAHNINLDQSLAARSDLLGGSFRFGQEHNKNDLMIQSSKLEESVKALDRVPIRIEGLTEFLRDEQYRFTGVYCNYVGCMHLFWKTHVSVAYRELFGNNRTNIPDAHLFHQAHLDQSKKSTKRKSRSRSPDKLPENKDWSKFLVPKSVDKENYGVLRGGERRKQKMEIFGHLYEMDVVYTLEKDFFEERDNFKSQQIAREMQQKESFNTKVRDYEQGTIQSIIEAFYEDLIEFEKNKLAEECTIKEEVKQDVKPKNLTLSFDVAESIDKDKIEPRQPTIQEDLKKTSTMNKSVKKETLTISFQQERFDKDMEKLTKSITEEKKFMLNLFFYSRQVELTNDADKLFTQYRECQEKMRHGLIWAKGDEDVRKLINAFFQPEKLLKRILLLHAKKPSLKHCSTFGFYLQLKKQERLLNLINKKYIRLESEPGQDKNESKKKVIEDLPQKYPEVTDLPVNCSIEKLVLVFENMKRREAEILTRTRQEEELKKMKDHKKKLRRQVFGKDKAIKMEKEEGEYDTDEERKALTASKNVNKGKDVFNEDDFTSEELYLREQLKRDQERQKQKKANDDDFGPKTEEQKKKEEEEKRQQRINNLAKPKDKWKRLRILKELRKKFPHDIQIKKMLEHELQTNRLFRYPQEYDLFDAEFEAKIKYQESGGLEIKEVDGKAAKVLLEEFMKNDEKELKFVMIKMKEQRLRRKYFEEFIEQKVLAYIEMVKKRLQGQEQTLRTFVSSVYHEALEKHQQYVNMIFPFRAYGTKKSSETYKKSYPFEFKQYFFKMVKSFVRTTKGYKKAQRAIPTFIVPGGKRCHIHQADCPQGCQYVTLNKKVILKHAIMRRRQKVPKAFRSRVWRRNDFKNSLKEVFLLNSELTNCTFEPETGTMSKNMNDTLKANPNLGNSDLIKDPEPDAFFMKLGKNFEKCHPEVYKAGVLKRARLKYSQGKYEEAWNTLSEGFNILSIRRFFDPVFREKWHKKQREKEQMEREGKTTSVDRSSSQKPKVVSFLRKEEPDEQKKRSEEDYESKKLTPILREAFEFIMIMINRKKQAQKSINKVESERETLKGQVKKFKDFKRSMTRLDPSKGEKILFKSIMCPLKERCPKVQNRRWPTTNIKTVKQFGENCPFAHHPMELCFPESIITKLKSSSQTIKTITQKMDEEKSRQPFKPAGGLFDCVGCNGRSGKHMGGPCNLCRYKEMADEESKKYTDKRRKNSLMRKMELRQSLSGVRDEQQEMSQIRQALDLDNNYTKKFGLFKKACVLYFYGRYNDAFDEIAKAVKIIQDQKEIERQKQVVIEKRWRFKLGLDDGFELPIPIEQIDPSKVDEKFLKKMDLGGQVALSTLKLFIENVHPNKNEEYSKHAFLNQLIEDHFEKFEAAIEDKMETIKKMKKQVERLDELADRLEGNGSPGSSPERAGNDMTKTQKNKRSKLCPHLLANKSCPQAKVPKCLFVHSEEELQRLNKEAAREAERTGNERKHYQMCDKVLKNEKCPLVGQRQCPYEHNPILFDLIPPENKIKNLNGVIQSQTYKLKHMKPLEPWRPAKSGDIEHTDLMDMSSKRRKKEGEEDEDEEHNKKKKSVKKSIFERENVFKKPYEQQE